MDFYNKEKQERVAHTWLASILGIKDPTPNDSFVAKAAAFGYGPIKHSRPDYDPRCESLEAGTLRKNKDGSFTQSYKVVALPAETIAANLAKAKDEKLAQANAECDAILRGLVAKYPEMEISTFAKQEAEAKALAENPKADAPFLTALAANRGIELPELAARVLAHADAFGKASGVVIGQRQAFEDVIDYAETLADVDAINVAYLLPWEA